MPRKTPTTADLPPIDWKSLLVGRLSIPPREWWVTEAIERGTSGPELRAEAALTLLLEPEGKALLSGSRLAQLPPVVAKYQRITRNEIYFACSLRTADGDIPPTIFHIAVDIFLRLFAASQVMNPKGSDQLSPELADVAKAAAEVVTTYQARGLDKVPRHLLEEWQAKYATVSAQTPSGPAPADSAPAPARQRRAKPARSTARPKAAAPAAVAAVAEPASAKADAPSVAPSPAAGDHWLL